jgi:hypothetical protein
METQTSRKSEAIRGVQAEEHGIANPREEERGDCTLAEAPSWFDDNQGNDTRDKDKSVCREQLTVPKPLRTARRRYWPSSSSSSPGLSRPEGLQSRRGTRRCQPSDESGRAEVHEYCHPVTQAGSSRSRPRSSISKLGLWEQAANIGSKLSTSWAGLYRHGATSSSKSSSKNNGRNGSAKGQQQSG